MSDIVEFSGGLEEPDGATSGQYPYPLSSVTSREHWLTQEHFGEVEERIGNPHADAFSSHTYAAVVKPKQTIWRPGQRPIPFKIDTKFIGLVVCDREAAGLSPQPGPPFSLSGNLAVQAGSFLDFVGRLTRGEVPRVVGFGKQRLGFINQVADIVRVQIEEADSE